MNVGQFVRITLTRKMKRAVAVSAIFAILLNVISASDLTADEKWASMFSFAK